MFDYKARQRRFAGILEENGIAALFLAPSADLEYLAGVERQIPNFGEASYAHGWAIGGFFRPDADPVFVFPRMFATFDLPDKPEGELVVINENDDGVAMFASAMQRDPVGGTVAVGDRVWSEATLHLAKSSASTGCRPAAARQRHAAGQGRGRAGGDGPGRRHRREGDGRRHPAVVAGISMGGLVEAVDTSSRSPARAARPSPPT